MDGRIKTQKEPLSFFLKKKIMSGKDTTIIGPSYHNWNKDLCTCIAANAHKRTVDHITVKDPIDTTFTSLSKDYVSGSSIEVASLEDINVGSALTVGADAAKLVLAINNNTVTLNGPLAHAYTKGTVVSVQKVHPQVRVYMNLPYASPVLVERRNDPRGFYTEYKKVGADGSVVIRKDTAELGATATWGRAGTNTTEKVSIVPFDATSYKACFFYGLKNSDVCN